MVWLGWGRIPFVRLEWPVVGTSLEALSSPGTSSLAWIHRMFPKKNYILGLKMCQLNVKGFNSHTKQIL